VHPPGTIIFPKIGGAIATNKRRILSKRTAIDNNCLGIIPANDILPEWVYLQLSSIDLSKYQAGTSVPALSQGTLGEISISIPDSQEQVNVISKVTELMLICDELEEGGISLDASHERLVEEFLSALTNSQNANEFKKYWVRISDIFDSLFISEGDIDRLKKSILILAVTGRLVEQMPRDGIHQEFNDYSKGNSDYMLPESWILAKLGEIGEASIGLTYSPNDISNNGIPVLRSTNIQNGLIDLTELVRVSTVIKPSLFLRKDDLLICSRNGSKSLVGKSALIEGLNEPMTFGAFMAVLRSPYARYIKIFLDSDLFRRLLNGVETTTINQITQNNLKNTLIPLPPLEEQHRIVERVSHLFLVCDNLKSLIFHANKQQQLIADVLVDQALA